MRKFKSFHIGTKKGGGGTLEIVEKFEGGYLATYHGLSGLAHVIEHGRETPLAANIDFIFADMSYDDLIKKCRAEIEKRDSEILCFDPVK